MKKYLLIMLFLSSTAAQAKGGLLWKIGRTGTAGYIAYQAHNRISDKIADTIADEFAIRYKMYRNNELTRDAAQKEVDTEELELKNTVGMKHESIVRVLLTLAAFELSKGILDGYVYEALMG